MKRPQSVKHVSNQWLPSHSDHHLQLQKQTNTTVNQQGHKPASNTSNLTRLLPKRIHYDKEKLYYETLQLKTALNVVSDENYKLKTRVAILEKEKERIHKAEQPGSRAVRSGTTGQATEKENLAIIHFKKMVRQSKEEAGAAKIELEKLKKAVRYTKINELDLERQVLIQENKRLAKIVGQLQSQLDKNGQYQTDITQMERQLRLQAEKIRESDDSIAKYEELLQELQLKNRQLSQKLLVWEKKYQRDLAVHKRKADQLARANEVLKSEKKATEQRMNRQRKLLQNAKKPVRPASSHPITHASQPFPANDRSKEKQEALEINIRLKKELEDAKYKLAVSESRLKQQLGDNVFSKSKEPFELILTSKEDEVMQPSRKEAETVVRDGKSKSKAANAESTAASQNLQEIRGILTYRMKYNRYTFQQLKSDIEASPLQAFTREDIFTMLTEEPFSLNNHYARQLLNDCYQRNKLANNQQLSALQLLEALRGVIQDFELLPEEEQEHVLYQIADSITKHRTSLEGAFEALETPEGEVTFQQMEEILRAHTSLERQAIDLAICYVAVDAQSLNRIRYLQLLDKFLINQASQQSEGGSKALKPRAESEKNLQQSYGAQDY